MTARSWTLVIGVLCANTLVLAPCRAGEKPDQPASTPKAVVVSLAAADDKTVPSQKTKTSVGGQTNATVLTGSYIPTKVKRTGRITDGELDVTVIDRATIDQSGATSVAQVLAREPGLRIRSH
jgi:outer membrane cobalamin receptor